MSLTEPTSQLWKDALGPGGSGDENSGARDALRASMAQVRRDADELATRIAVDLPEFTVHDGSHLDALWPLMDLIGPPDLSLTPTEAWTLGVAVVLHDLGLAVAAYPGGRGELRQTFGWPDARAAALRARLGRSPTQEELEVNDPELDLAADATVLRQRHAERARELLDARWDGEPLLVDATLRDALGGTAGMIASSHWWSVEELVALGDCEGAPGGMPQTWTVRPVLLAVLLRLADAAHLDASRAPRFGRAVRQLSTRSTAYWEFQSRLRQPILDGERLKFVSSRPFSLEHADAWWLGLDHLRCLDEELVATDSLLQAQGLPRMAARSVLGARDPAELARIVKPDDWEPVDARVEVSDVSKLIQRLGGRALYGETAIVPLRELIQNASDAVRARQALQPEFRGAIEARVSEDGKEVIVKDDGVGMGVNVLTGALLDFGRSLWESAELSSVLPGLQAAGFQPAGRFGIGFFSVFMWADKVEVISRTRSASAGETRVLSFFDGPGSRPVLRFASPQEQLNDSGTVVRLWIRNGEDEISDILSRKGSFGENDPSPVQNLVSALGRIAPALEVDFCAAVGDDDAEWVLRGGDWLTVPGVELLERVGGSWLRRSDGGLASRVHLVGLPENPAGRAALDDGYLQSGALVAGGLRVGPAPGIAGVLAVDRVDAARTHGTPVANPEAVASWATRQAERLLTREGSNRLMLAAMIQSLGGDSKSLSIAKTREGYLDRQGVLDWAKDRNEVAIVDASDEAINARDYQAIPPEPVITLASDVLDAKLNSRSMPSGFAPAQAETLADELVELVLKAWSHDPRIEVYEEEREDLFDVAEATEPVHCFATVLVREAESD